MTHSRRAGLQGVYVPQADARGGLVEGIDVYPVDTLGRLVTHFRDYHPIEPYHPSRPGADPDYATTSRYQGPGARQAGAGGGGRRAYVLMSGPPGSGNAAGPIAPSILPA